MSFYSYVANITQARLNKYVNRVLTEFVVKNTKQKYKDVRKKGN